MNFEPARIYEVSKDGVTGTKNPISPPFICKGSRASLYVQLAIDGLRFRSAKQQPNTPKNIQKLFSPWQVITRILCTEGGTSASVAAAVSVVEGLLVTCPGRVTDRLNIAATFLSK